MNIGNGCILNSQWLFIFRQDAQSVPESTSISMLRDYSDLECVWNLKQLCFVGQHEVSSLMSYSILTLKPIRKYKNTRDKQYNTARRTKPLPNTAKNRYNQSLHIRMNLIIKF